ncbi:hypothetical protein ACFX2A_032773 [Malus domestica]
MEMSVSSLARMAQASDESPMDYFTRFKSARNWCRVPLPEVEFVRLALNGLDVEYKKKFLGANFGDMYELAQHVEQYDYLLREEKMSKPLSRGTIYKNPTVNYASTEGEESQYVSVNVAGIVIDKPYVCKALTQINSKEVKTHSATEETAKTSKVYTFDITKAEAIFDQLLSAKIIKLRPGHNIPKAEDFKGRTYCKYHNSTKHATNNCVIFRDDIQSWIDKGKLKFPENCITVDTDPFPSAIVGMVDARLPKSKGKYALIQHIRKQSSQPRLKIDLFSNTSLTRLSGPAIVEPMSNYNDEGNGGPIVPYILKKGSQPRLKIDLFSNAPPTELSEPAIVKSMSDSSEDENGGPIILCNNCKARVVLIEPKRKLPPMQMLTSQHQSTITAKPSKEPSEGKRQKVFDRLGPRKQTNGPTSIRRCLAFDSPFYNEDYYSHNSSSSSSFVNQKTFRPPKPRDQRWYIYNSPTGMYTVLSKSQKRRRQRIDCLAQRQVAQPVSATKWQPKETAGSRDDQPTPIIMAELQG